MKTGSCHLLDKKNFLLGLENIFIFNLLLTESPKLFARSIKAAASSSALHPNLSPSGHCATLASHRKRTTKLKRIY